MYKARITVTGNGMQGTRGMGEGCYISGKFTKHSERSLLIALHHKMKNHRNLGYLDCLWDFDRLACLQPVMELLYGDR